MHIKLFRLITVAVMLYYYKKVLDKIILAKYNTMIDTLEVIRNIKKIYASDNVINALVGMEKVMDDVNLYAYHNWKKRRTC